MNVLVINAGSSSLKYQLLDTKTREVYAKGNCERIGIDGSFVGHEERGGEKQKLEVALETLRARVGAPTPGSLPGVLESLSQEVTAALRSAARTVQDRLQARGQFDGVDRFQQIVVGADPQRLKPVMSLIFIRDHDDGRIAVAPQFAQHIPAVAARQAQVQQHQLRL